MAEAIRMPLLSDTMKEGIIAAWHKNVGDSVKADDVLAEVETDKATMEVVPYVDGTLLYIGVEKGKAAKVNEIIAIIGKPGEDFSALLDNKSADAPAAETSTENAAPEPETAPKTSAPAEPAKPLSTNATVIRMPLLSDTMKEGKIIEWHKKVGDSVKADDNIADVETDKATMEIVPYVEGTLLYIGVEAGQSAAINQIIAIIGKAGTDVQQYLDVEKGTGNTAQATKEATPASVAPDTAGAPVAASSTASSGDSNGRVFASPLAKRIAKEKGIDLHSISGTGDGGRIIKRDIDNYKETATASPAAAGSAPDTQFVAGTESHTDMPLSQMRKVIAKRLAESKFSAPHFYLRMTITMDNAVEARKAINNVSPVKVSFNDMIIKAVAAALRKHPDVNSSWMGESIRRNNHIHIGTAVAVEDGLIVPVIKFADAKSLSQIAGEAKSLYDKAYSKKLQPQEFTGNTFTISNLGMMDIDEFTAIINPPDSCILAVGKITPTPVVEDGQIVVRQLLKLTLSCDHRVVDGAVGAKFLQTLKAYLENPVTMLA